MAAASGRLVTENLNFDGGREVTVFVPSVDPAVVVYAGDGQLIAPWGRLLGDPALPSTMIVGVHRVADEMGRIREYSPGVSTSEISFDPQRFAAHEAFFLDEVPAWLQSRFGISFPVERTAVFGVSAGGELALAMGVRHPDRFGAVLCASPGAGYQPPRQLSKPLPRFYFVAGRQEPFFLNNAERWATALRDAGADVTMTERDGTHGSQLWQQELPTMIAWAFTIRTRRTSKTHRP
ncbi:esterase [Planctomonas sp. JC2975]|nr:esterase [Planctomonas sp. JC2975]